MRLNFDYRIETLDPVSIFILRPTYPAYEYYARNIQSALAFICDNEHHLFTSEVFIRSVPYTKLFEINPDHYIDNVLFKPFWKH